jgi:hypothetical protein
MLAAGVNEGDPMSLAGWRSREMLGRCACSTASEHAIAASRRLDQADKL